MKKGPLTPKGFRDIGPPLAKKRRDTVNIIADVLEDNGFVPIETPIIEFAQTLLGKYGDEEKLIYQFTDRGGRKLALRYDLTVPFARYVANNPNLLTPTFSRYQTGSLFRGEKPQKRRYREFTQFDFDTVGSGDINEDAKIIACAILSVRKAGLKKAQMAINDRKYFDGMPQEVIRAWDKYYKIGIDGVKNELSEKGLSEIEINGFLDKLNQGMQTDDVKKLFEILKSDWKLKIDKDLFFDKTLARGLDYYTGIVFELKPTGKPEEQSIGGGGRYDDLIGMFAGKNIPAVGFSFGLDRLTEEVR